MLDWLTETKKFKHEATGTTRKGMQAIERVMHAFFALNRVTLKRCQHKDYGDLDYIMDTTECGMDYYYVPSENHDFWSDESTATICGKTYCGSVPKRFAKLMKELYDVKIDRPTRAAIGNVLAHCKAVDCELYYHYCRDFDWDAGTFRDGDSCYFGCRNYSRRMLYDAGAWVCLLYGKLFPDLEVQPIHHWRYRQISNMFGTGRFWVKPLPKLNKMIIFNWYRPRMAENWNLDRLIELVRVDFPEAVGEVAEFQIDQSEEGQVFVNQSKCLVCHLDGEGVEDYWEENEHIRLDLPYSRVEWDLCKELGVPENTLWGTYPCCSYCGEYLPAAAQAIYDMHSEPEKIKGRYFAPKGKPSEIEICKTCHDEGVTDCWTIFRPEPGAFKPDLTLQSLYQFCAETKKEDKKCTS